MRPGPASILQTVRLSPEQLTEINRRAGLGRFDGKARAEYLIGSALDEDELLERVAEIRDAERAQLRGEIERERSARSSNDKGPAGAGP